MASKSVRVGLIDSGVAVEQEHAVVGARGFALNSAGEVIACAVEPDRMSHGSQLAEIILTAAPQARLLNAQIFRDSSPIAPVVVAAALDWLMGEQVGVVNLSFGLRQDRTVLSRAVAAAVEAGVILVCSTPARGEPVFPAAYRGVLRVCGDARCGPGELSALPDGPAQLGACPHPPTASKGSQPVGGASFAAAQVSGLLAAFFLNRPQASVADAFKHLESLCRFWGRERRSPDDQPSRC
ncbi:MAG: peptidase S8 and S53 subtilisin kexin sedolisin [Candidatus Competibacteraceae bacterium]|nr:peptidase S8 and S53 subtilisin kexin sedolisin [Candidatus Competibacteraceae bacterium]